MNITLATNLLAKFGCGTNRVRLANVVRLHERKGLSLRDLRILTRRTRVTKKRGTTTLTLTNTPRLRALVPHLRKEGLPINLEGADFSFALNHIV